MIEMIKNKIWELLKEKEVSLVMIYDIIRDNDAFRQFKPFTMINHIRRK